MQYETGLIAEPSPWYLAYTEPRRESYAQEQLQRQLYDTYLPLYGRVEPMFPRYLFFRPSHPGQSIAPVRSTRGVQSVVRFGCLYAQLSQGLIDDIREQENRHREHAVAGSVLQAGQRVRVKASAPALAGLEGLVHASADRRVIVLMEILGRQTPVSLQADKVEVI